MLSRGLLRVVVRAGVARCARVELEQSTTLCTGACGGVSAMHGAGGRLETTAASCENTSGPVIHWRDCQNSIIALPTPHVLFCIAYCWQWDDLELF